MLCVSVRDGIWLILSCHTFSINFQSISSLFYLNTMILKNRGWNPLFLFTHLRSPKVNQLFGFVVWICSLRSRSLGFNPLYTNTLYFEFNTIKMTITERAKKMQQIHILSSGHMVHTSRLPHTMVFHEGLFVQIKCDNSMVCICTKGRLVCSF